MKTRRFCPKCGRPVIKSKLTKSPNRYTFQCYGCEEDFWKVEVLRIKDLERVKILRKETIWREKVENGHTYSIYKPYPYKRLI